MQKVCPKCKYVVEAKYFVFRDSKTKKLRYRVECSGCKHVWYEDLEKA